jgi:Mn2+/Fe2+ NRAMP family transporter
MEKNEITNKRNKLLKKYYSSNSTLVRVTTMLFCLLPIFFLMYEPLPRGASIHLLFFAQTILFLLLIVASQINWKLDLILKIYNLDKQEDIETVDYEPKKRPWIIVVAVLIVVIVGVLGYKNQMARNQAIWDEFDRAHNINQEQKKEPSKDESDASDK